MPPKKRPALSGLAAFGFTAKIFKKEDVIAEESDLPEASAMSTVSITDTAAKGQEQSILLLYCTFYISQCCLKYYTFLLK